MPLQRNKASPEMKSLIVTLKSPFVGKSTAEIHEATGISVNQINKIYHTAIQLGFNPEQRPLEIKTEHVADARRSRWPTIQIPELSKELISKI
ncbi:uncharacterized protein BDCG_16170 [Blastomyces dermatitidis ER-3]|uniref:Uncharacterized protein n=2 Tax=Ajellomyces dermatitidis TaxID=5039 RepID=A0A0J9ELI9_AJEDA|nr:uncharacterized protein BDCG_16170 [Blastomyces dermatitidis ER-3]EQL37277.1 hypothetical protein BDFG_01251 [Blastomyces dermatitidis ATCC 26199]KMW67193.1 hypothetical protein BDDG_11970 [Blastomyces dermatitidis ATCC 18188]OAS99500.1 hypothetical protein BDCG_16170 [Blastomyces dermatitidis ER-3]